MKNSSITSITLVTLNRKTALYYINNRKYVILLVRARKYFCNSEVCCDKISFEDAEELFKTGYMGCSCNLTIYKIVMQLLVNIPSEIPSEIPS
jgi:hypothetical protein